MQIEKLTGLIAAPFSPMKEDGSINKSIIPDYYRMLKANGVKGAFICGSTGEGPSLTLNEKKSIVEAWAEATKHDHNFKVMTLLGGTSIQESKEFAIYASKAGIYGISFTSPYYYKPADIKMLAKACIEVGRAAPDLPFYYYHIPILNGVYFPMIDLLEEIDGKLPNFAGIKFTHEDFMDFQSCLRFKDYKYDLLWGRDENLLPALAIGAKGAVGSTFNYAAPLYHDLIEAFISGDLEKAGDFQQVAIDMISLLGKYGGMATGKSYMKIIGLDCGEFRLPVKNMEASEFKQFEKDVKELNFDSFKSQISQKAKV